ncbi:MAG: GNVR domain-containing protein [Roseiarcus sp.]|jgi:succinoglycan biosynthesis transport protein ExoP
MLTRPDRPGASFPDLDAAALKSAGPVDFDLLLAAGRRQARVIFAAAAIGLILGLADIVAAVPQYTATTDLLIDSQKDKNDLSASISEATFDTGAIDSQVEVLKSEKIALSVIATLKLTGDPEFMGARGALFGRAMATARSALDFTHWFVSRDKSDPEAQFELQRAAIDHLKSNSQVRRIARTYVLAIDYTAPDPAKAATIANAFADAYLTDQLDSKFEATRRASGWMQARIAQLKADSIASDSAVQKFKADRGLITADGKLVSDQQMTELNTQLMLAQGDTARAEARFNQISGLLKSGQTDGAVTDSLGNPVITELRQKYLAASKTEAELESKLGGAHVAVINLRREMAEYQRLIFEELQRIAETYRSEGQVARAKEESMNVSMSALISRSAGTNQTMVQLRELEREAETYRTLYQAFLQRYQETVQQQSYPTTEARVITEATPPTAPSYPKRSMTLSFSLIIGSLAGIGIGALREYRDRVFRVASQVRDELGLELLGMLEVIDDAVPIERTGADPDADEQVQPRDSLQRYAIDHPISSFSETLRSVKVAADLALADRRPKIIGVISVLPGEGKSTVSKNLGSLLAHLGAKTLLIDGDLRNPGMTRAIAAHAQIGVLEAIRGEVPLRDCLVSEPDSGLLVLPAVIKKRVHHTSEILNSPGMRAVLKEAGEHFEYVVVDLPPLGPVVDVRAAASMFDAFVFVVEWGRTARSVVRTILASEGAIYDKCLGVVFNKVHMGKINLYAHYGSKDYYHGTYDKYYRSEKESA